ncbi:MAG: hypothetical protein Q7S50_01285 [bacterium]|nr:hypothetical protein [bacterium]
MTERQNPFTVVGGREHVPNAAQTRPEAAAVLAGLSPKEAESKLIWLNKEIRANLPADYKSKIRNDLVEQAAGGMLAWTVAQLYTTLSQPDLWTRSSRTVAALEEVRLRMLAGSMAPRK